MRNLHNSFKVVININYVLLKLNNMIFTIYNKLQLLNKDESAIELYSDDDYSSDNIVSETKNKETYYAKTSSDNISVKIKDVDQNYVKVFKATSYSEIGEVKTATKVKLMLHLFCTV